MTIAPAIVFFFVLALRPAIVDARDADCPFLDAAEPLLNSERIERCFGSYGIELLPPVEELRIACLYSTADGARSWRTLAMTALVADPPPQLAELLQRIREGGSIGATLESSGWQAHKASFALEEVAIENGWKACTALNRVPAGTTIAMHAYLLTAARGVEEHPVARVAEFHHPDYLRLTHLQALHGSPRAADAEERRFLEQVLGTWRSASAAFSRGGKSN